LASLLLVNGRVPRRAVLLEDGSLADKTAHPEAKEVDVLSKVCELYRASSGQPSHPRHTASLLEMALLTNGSSTWDAIRDDLVTGDFDLRAAAAVIQHGRNAVALVSCLVDAKHERHFLNVACVVSQVLPHLGTDACQEVAQSIGAQLRGVVEALCKHGSVLARDACVSVVQAFGKMIGSIGVPDVRVGELVSWALQERQHAVLGLFAHCPTSYIVHRPQILAQLLDSVEVQGPRGAPPPATNTMVTNGVIKILARVATEHPDVFQGHSGAVSRIVMAALADRGDGSPLDPLSCMAAAVLVRSCPGFDDTTVIMAGALSACAARLLH
jgi:hypothetical protein